MADVSDDHPPWCCVQGSDLMLHLRVRPRASPEGFSGVRAGRLQVRVSAAPVEGEANERLMRMLARELATPVAALVLVRGVTSRDKDVLVRSAAARHAQIVALFTARTARTASSADGRTRSLRQR